MAASTVIGADGLPLGSSPSQSLSYSQVAEPDEVRPKNHLAVVVELLDKDFNNDKYIDAMLKHIKLEDITHVSRISRKRLCFYLSSEEKVTQLVNITKYVNVEGQQVRINHMVNKAVKVVISNADASISNSAIKRFLNLGCNIKTVSRVSELKVSTNNERYKNILSFRRVVYILPEDMEKLPSSQKFKGDGMTFNVFFNTGNSKCFICGSEDHFAKQCETDAASQRDVTKQSSTDGNKDIEARSAVSTPAPLNGRASVEPPALMDDKQKSSPSAPELSTRQEFDDTANSITSDGNNAAFKRPLSVDSRDALSLVLKNPTKKKNIKVTQDWTTDPDEPDGDLTLSSTANDGKKEDKKKGRRSRKRTTQKEGEKLSLQIASQLEPARALIEVESERTLIGFDEMARLLAASSGTGEAKRELAKNYIKAGKKDEVIELLVQTHSCVSGSTKARITRLLNALRFNDNSNDVISIADETGAESSASEETPHTN